MEDNSLYAVIMAGGSGTRFWPMSLCERPKQLVTWEAGSPTFLQATVQRLSGFVKDSNSWLVVHESQVEGSRAVLPSIPAAQFLAEPIQRNTAAAIGLAALHLQVKDPDSVMIVLPADHHVGAPQALCDALAEAARIARDNYIVTLGIEANKPETGYGYIRRGDALGACAFEVAEFLEKPNLELAKEFVASGKHSWNAGMFVCRPKIILDEIQRQLPDLSSGLGVLEEALREAGRISDELLREIYASLPSVSIDYGVMEGAEKVAVIPVDCGWSDVGSFDALPDVFEADLEGNVRRGRTISMDNKNCTLIATDGGVVSALGCENLIVVHTQKATLVLPREMGQRVRDVVKVIEENKWQDLL
ncbi:MAG: sugar phosphate nucleotidyltransferase [Myxococcota bacterium]|nr:sugar phosphate nucleotidyltransferase [Myxococcota bacterium]